MTSSNKRKLAAVVSLSFYSCAAYVIAQEPEMTGRIMDGALAQLAAALLVGLFRPMNAWRYVCGLAFVALAIAMIAGPDGVYTFAIFGSASGGVSAAAFLDDKSMRMHHWVLGIAFLLFAVATWYAPTHNFWSLLFGLSIAALVCAFFAGIRASAPVQQAKDDPRL